MSDYISREAAIKAVKKERGYTGKFSFEEEHAWAVGFQQGISFALSGVAAIPAADVRPVVLCRDCVMYECHEYDGGLKYVCRLFKRQMQETDFCSYGEKREES